MKGIRSLIFLVVLCLIFPLAADADPYAVSQITGITISPEHINPGDSVTLTITTGPNKITDMIASFSLAEIGSINTGVESFSIVLNQSGKGKFVGTATVPHFGVGGTWYMDGITFKMYMSYQGKVNTVKERISATELAANNLVRSFTEYNANDIPSMVQDTTTTTTTTTTSTTLPITTTVNNITTVSTPTTTTLTTPTTATAITNIATPTVLKDNGVFQDIKGHWAKGSIEALIKKGYINGYPDGTFKPNKTITRAEFLKILVKAVGLSVSGGSSSFKDTSSHWAKNEIVAAKKAHITDGYNDGSFKPNNNITRAEIVSMINNAKKLSGSTFKKFQDVKDTHWAKAAIYVAVANGIASGYPDGSFKPNKNATRAEAACMIEAMLKK